jgi:hypothetical protein
MARCETCGGSVRRKLAATHTQDPHITASKWEFDDDVGHSRATKTFFCSPECAIEGIRDGRLREQDDDMFWVDRHGGGPSNYPSPDVLARIERGLELLDGALDDLDTANDAADPLRMAVETGETAQLFVQQQLDAPFYCPWCEQTVDDVERRRHAVRGHSLVPSVDQMLDGFEEVDA